MPSGARPWIAQTKSRISRTNERAHMLFGCTRSHRSSAAPGGRGGLRAAVAPQVGPQDQFQMPDLADGARPDQVAHLAAVRLVAQLVVHPGHAAGRPLGDRQHALGLPSVQRHRLLTQHVLPRLERGDGEARVRVRRRGDEHEVHFRRAGQLGAVVVYPGNREFLRRRLRIRAARWQAP